MPTTNSIIRMGWPERCPQKFCRDPELRGHHHHGNAFYLDHHPCRCDSTALWVPGTKPIVKAVEKKEETDADRYRQW